MAAEGTPTKQDTRTESAPLATLKGLDSDIATLTARIATIDEARASSRKVDMYVSRPLSRYDIASKLLWDTVDVADEVDLIPHINVLKQGRHIKRA